jgi:hypothetical protein|tara:strand:+ start:1620 stop:2048 length:429 start_codon:yes stop_codon:yes gene_type:complete
MAKKLISDVLTEASKLTKKEDRINYLRTNSSPALRDVLRIAFDADVVSLLPTGAPSFERDDAPAGHEFLNLHRGHRRFKYFFKGPVANETPALRREGMFLSFIESLNGVEADMVIAAKDKKLKIKGITKALVKEAFPNLIVK